MSRPAIAFFDLDRTLLAANSGTLWIKRELRLGHITRMQALRAGTWLVRYHLGFASLQDAVGRAIGSLAGTPSAPLIDRTRAFYEEEVRHLYRPGAHAALARHRELGHTLAMLTSSSGYLSELAARELSIEHVLANRLELDARGHHTGRPEGTLCFGRGKLVHAEALATRLSVQLRDCAFYTDSVSDLPVMEAVGHPVAVNPDPRLRRTAHRRGWPVQDWGAPAAASSSSYP